MKKTYIPKMDRNTYIDNYFTSSMIPFQSTFEQQSSVKIIELDDTNTSDSDEYPYDQKHAWSYVNKKQLQKQNDSYKVNTKARDKRRMNRVSPEMANKAIDYLTYENDNETNNSNALYNEVTTERIPNNPLNCFTIINNDLADSDHTSSDNEAMKIIECGDVVLESDYKKNIKSTETNYNRNTDSKRTIWIYSFKNRNLLTEDSENVSTEDSTSSSSFENNTDYKERIATPIPSYIPRLNFYVAATLPPVTEVTEPLQKATNNVDNSETLVSKSQTSPQFLDQRSPTLRTTVPSQNIINWMALSPRERRRNIKINLKDDIIQNDCEQNNSVSNKQTENVPFNIDKNFTYVIRNGNRIEDNEISPVQSIDQLDDNTIDEKGDHSKIRQLKKPQILLNTITPKITDPIEKLNSDEWIGHGNEYKESLEIDEKQVEHEKPVNFIRCAGDRLLNKNMTLLKPVEWAQYLPITESMPSLHLSLPSDIIDERKPWFKHIIKYFRCCKMCK